MPIDVDIVHKCKPHAPQAIIYEFIEIKTS